MLQGGWIWSLSVLCLTVCLYQYKKYYVLLGPFLNFFFYTPAISAVHRSQVSYHIAGAFLFIRSSETMPLWKKQAAEVRHCPSQLLLEVEPGRAVPSSHHNKQCQVTPAIL